MSDLGRTLISIGLVLIVVGVLLLAAGRLPFLGRLPGDILVRRPGFTFYFPLGTSILLSALLSLLFWFLRR